MIYTARGTKEGGLGLAVSEDLYEWKRVGEGPVESSRKRYQGTWKGGQVTWRILADPYVYPEPIDGWYYLVANSRIEDVPVNESGCIGMLRSRDLKIWQDPVLLSWTGWFQRSETPQLWHRHGRW